MSGTRKRSSVELGHDAFLDIVANLVGILIILVVVLGTQSQQVVEELQADVEPDAEQLSQLAVVSSHLKSVRADSQQMEQNLRQLDAELAARQKQRAMLSDLLAIAKQTWEEKQESLDQQRQAAAQLLDQEQRLEQQLAETRGERESLDQQQAPVVAVEHLPTPMAKTVFGEEVHFRLKANRLSVVPIGRLLDEIKQDVQRSIGGRDGPMESRVGPVQGYVANYEMMQERNAVASGGRVGMATRVELVGLVVEPIKEPHGQPVERVLAERRGQSMLDIELAGRDPAKTTITVWVYPDSFAMMRRLKEHLYERGYATAARPLPMDHPISGSPSGTRSRAQ